MTGSAITERELRVGCPTCRAWRGEHCQTRLGERCAPHLAREEKANRGDRPMTPPGGTPALSGLEHLGYVERRSVPSKADPSVEVDSGAGPSRATRRACEP